MRNALLALVLVVSLPSFASAQTAAPPGPGPVGEQRGRIGASAVLGLPLGDWGDAVNLSLGVLGVTSV